MSTVPVGTAPLVRLAARRDRVMVAIWLAVLALVCFASAAATPGLYDTEAERVQAAETINASPGVVALYGPILDIHSEGELAMTKMTVTYAVFVAIMTVFVVRRHTRRDEEDGQAELLGGTAIGRDATIGAAVVFGAAVVGLLGLLVALGNTAAGLPLAGSMAFGASWAGTGLVGVGITVLSCQLSPSSRTCAGIASAAIGVLFALRAIGDTSAASFLSWLSPFGWNTQLRAYGETRWWVLLLYAALAAALVGAALALHSRRDLGAGILAPRPGPAVGSPRLGDVLALTLRVHVPMLIGWTIAVAVMGTLFGAISPSFDGLVSDSVEDLLEGIGGVGAIRDTLIGAVASVSALIVTCFSITVIGHSGGDEEDGRTEQVLATATSRARLFLATILVALAGATWLLLVTGLSLAIGVGGNSDRSFGEIVVAGIGQAPAVWVVVALAAVFFALDPKWSVLGWGAVVLFGTLGQIGELLGLPDWVLRLSPYSHVPRLPLEDFAWGPALSLTAIAAVLLAGAWWSYRARDIG